MNEEIVKTDKGLVRTVIEWLSTGLTSTIHITQLSGEREKPMIFLKVEQKPYPVPNTYKVLCLTGNDEEMDTGDFNCVGIWIDDKRLLCTTDTMPHPFTEARKLTSYAIFCPKVLENMKQSLAFRFYYKYQQKYPKIEDIPKDIHPVQLDDSEVKQWLWQYMEGRYINNQFGNTGKDFFIYDATKLPALDIVSLADVVQYIAADKGERPQILHRLSKNLTKDKEDRLLVELKLSYLWDKAIQTYTPTRRAVCVRGIVDAVKQYQKTARTSLVKESPLFDLIYEDDDGKEYPMLSYANFLTRANELYTWPVLVNAEDGKVFVKKDKEGKNIPCKMENIKRVSKDGKVLYERK